MDLKVNVLISLSFQLAGKSDAVEVSMDASDPLMASSDIPSQARNASNQFFHPSQSFQVILGKYK